jgi:hypothetical protein
MLIVAIVSGIIVFIFAPSIYFMISKRSKSSDHDAFHPDNSDDIEHTTNDYSHQNSPPEIVEDFNRNSESNVTIEIVPESKNPMDHFK